jgi:NADH-quinone oxidoreductase subunit C
MNDPLQPISAALAERFAARPSEFRGQLRLEIDRAHLAAALSMLRDTFQFDQLTFISAVDDWPAEAPRIHVVYHLRSLSQNLALRLVVALPASDLSLPSAEQIYPNANWYERELYDMFGLHITGHSDLRRLIMPHDWVGHPLRKDYPLGYEEVQFSFNYDDIARRKPRPQE